MDEMNINAPTDVPNTDSMESLPGETQAETAARLYQIMVDGEQMEVDEDELKRGYAHNKAAQKRMAEAANMRKEAAQVMQMFKENPREAFKALGMDPAQFSQQYIQEQLEDAMLTDEQRELREYKRQVEAHEARSRQAQEEYQREQLAAEQAQYTEDLQNQIQNTLDSANVPKTAHTMSRIAYYMQGALANGFKEVTPQDVIEHVRNDYLADIKLLMSGLKDDQYEAFLGKDFINKIAKSTVSKAKTPIKSAPKSVNEHINKANKPKVIQSPRDFFKPKF